MDDSSKVWTIAIVVITPVIFGTILGASSKNKPPAPTATITDDAAAILSLQSGDQIRGRADAPVTLLEYGDFQCPACASYEPQLQQLLIDLPDSLRIVYRHLPLAQHKNAELTARTAEAAGKQGKFWDMHDLLYARQTEWANRGDATNLMLDYARELGLNADQLRQDLYDEDITDRIALHKGQVKALGVSSTPTFFVNGQPLANPRSYDAFKQVITDAAQQ